MSESLSTPNPEYGPLGFLGLYHAHTGDQIPASVEDLLRIEAHDFDLDLHKRVFADYAEEISTQAVLISNRPDYIAKALVVSVWSSENNPYTDKWEVSYMTNGEASYPHWTVDQSITSIQSCVREIRGTYKDMPLAENVETLIREQVWYRDAKDSTPDPLDLWGTTLLGEDEIRRNLLALSDVDPGYLIDMAGQKKGVFELGLAVVDFCARAGLEDKEDEVFARILSDDQQERLQMQMEAAAPQLSGEGLLDIDDEFKKLFGE